jgi:ribosomal protein S18 acetylase RimI-like enzyme
VNGWEQTLIFRIRKAALSDYDSLLPLFEQIDLLHRESLPEIFVKPEGSPRKKDYLEDLLQQPDVGFFIAEEKDQTIGFVRGVVRDSPPTAIFTQRRYAVVDSAVVNKDYQGMGVGRKLMETVHEWARDNGAESVELNVYEFNADAISFYEHLGYKTISRKMRKSLVDREHDRAG